MKQDGTYQAGGRGSLNWDLIGIGKRLIPPAIFFLIAFTIDMATNQQYSSVWGSGAILASVFWLFPSVLPTLLTVGAYAIVWIGFNLVRAFSDDAGLGLADVNTIADRERAFFGGELPTVRLQDAFFNPDAIGAHDIVLSIVHGSFFIVPFTLASVVWWKRRDLFRPYTVATGITFALGLVGFILLPTAPPWMAEPEQVHRVTHTVLAQVLDISTFSSSAGDQEGGFWFEPNHLAAMPSVHVAATVLVYLLMRQFGRIQAVLGAIYAVLMSFGIVYLGEHYVIDAIGGWVIAIAGWLLMRRVLDKENGRRVEGAGQ